MIVWSVGLILACYLLGAIPTGLLVGKRLKNLDVRSLGSGSTGTTNVFRALGWKAALLVLFVDILKGYVAVHLAYLAVVPAIFLPLVKILFGSLSIAGHNWPVFAGFRGGKGVATSFGVLLGISPLASLMALLLWLAVLGVTRIVSAASVTAAFSLPLLMIAYQQDVITVVFGVLLGAVAIFQHRENISRLLSGQEKPLDLSSLHK